MKSGLARIWSHLACEARTARRLFPDESLRRIERAVTEGERGHSAEIRIAIEAALPWIRVARGVLPRARALEVFSELRVWDTEGNNGVLVYLLVADQAIEIIGDRAALAALGAQELQSVCDRLGEALRAGRYEQGLLDAIARLNQDLVEAFPLVSPEGDENELPNRPAIL